MLNWVSSCLSLHLSTIAVATYIFTKNITWHVMWGYECKRRMVSFEKIWMEQMGKLEEKTATLFLCWLHSFPLTDLTFKFFHYSYLYNYYNYSRTLCMLSFRISYWDLIKFLNFADTTERGDRGWKQAQRHYDITDNRSCVLFLGH